MKKIISSVLVMCIVLGLMCTSVMAEEGYHDAYSDISTFADYYEKNEKITIGASYMSFGANSWISYKVDFGTVGARVFYMNYAIPESYAGKTITVHLDSRDSEPVLAFNTRSTGGWSSYVTDEFLLDEPITGEHIVYLSATRSGTCDNHFFGFKSAYTQVSAPEFTMTDENGDETESFDAAKNVTVNASFLSYASETADAYLVLETFDSTFCRVSEIKLDSVTEVNDKDTNHLLELGQDLTGIEGANLFAILIDGNFKPLANGVFLNAPENDGTVRSGEETLEYFIEGTSVTLYGSLSDSSERVLLGVRKSDAQISDYAMYEMIYETAVSEGKYSFTFTMDEDTPTGTYTALYTTDTGITKMVDFHYSRPGDIVDAFVEINESNAPTEDDEDDEDTIDEALNKWSTTLGINLEYLNGSDDRDWMYMRLYESLPFEDLNELNNAIDKTVFLHKVNTTDDDIASIEEYKSVTGIAEDEYFKDYFESVDKTVLADKLNVLMNEEEMLTDVASFIGVFRKAVVLAMMSEKIAWGDIDTMLVDFEDVLDTEYTEKYSSLSDKNRKKIAEEFLNKDFESIDEIVDLLVETYKTVTAKKPSSSGGGGGSSSGGGGSFSVGVPKIEKPQQEVVTTPAPETEPTSFEDLEGFEWAEEAIIHLAEKEIINGKSQNVFDPDANISREEFVKVLVLALGSVESDAVCSFSDISSDAWYYPYIATACKNGWVNGYADGTFGVGDSITREQMAAIFYRAVLDKDGATAVVNSTVSFVDYEEISGYAVDAVTNLAKAQLMNGVGMGMFSPKSNASRAESAVLLYKYLINR